MITSVYFADLDTLEVVMNSLHLVHITLRLENQAVDESSKCTTNSPSMFTKAKESLSRPYLQD
jgi:hypothetical protein